MTAALHSRQANNVYVVGERIARENLANGNKIYRALEKKQADRRFQCWKCDGYFNEYTNRNTAYNGIHVISLLVANLENRNYMAPGE